MHKILYLLPQNVFHNTKFSSKWSNYTKGPVNSPEFTVCIQSASPCSWSTPQSAWGSQRSPTPPLCTVAPCILQTKAIITLWLRLTTEWGTEKKQLYCTAAICGMSRKYKTIILLQFMSQRLVFIFPFLWFYVTMASTCLTHSMSINLWLYVLSILPLLGLGKLSWRRKTTLSTKCWMSPVSGPRTNTIQSWVKPSEVTFFLSWALWPNSSFTCTVHWKTGSKKINS